MNRFLVVLPLLLLAGCGSAPPDANTQAETAARDKTSTLGRVMDKGQGVATDSNISQINMILADVKRTNDDKAPATLDEAKAAAKGVTPEMWIDKATGKPLVYDPNTGTVSR